MAVAGNIGTLFLDIVIRDGQATVTTKKVETNLKGVEMQAHKTKAATTGMFGSFGAGAVGITAATTALTAFVMVLKGSLKTFIEEDAINQKLIGSLEKIGQVDAFSKLEKEASRLQWATGLADDQIKNTYATINSSTQDAGVSVEFTRRAADIVAWSKKNMDSQMDLVDAGKLVTKMYAGNIGIMSRYGIMLTDTEKKMLQSSDAAVRYEAVNKILEERFGGLADKMGGSYAGKIERYKAAWDDLKESFGGGVIKGFEDMNEIAVDNNRTVDQTAQTWQTWGDIIGGVGTGLGWVFNIASRGGAPVMALGEGILFSQKQFRNLKDELRGVGMLLAAQPPTTFMGGIINMAGETLLWLTDVKNSILDINNSSLTPQPGQDKFKNVGGLTPGETPPGQKEWGQAWAIEKKKNTGSRGSSSKQEKDEFMERISLIKKENELYEETNGKKGVSDELTQKALKDIEHLIALESDRAKQVEKMLQFEQALNELRERALEREMANVDRYNQLEEEIRTLAKARQDIENDILGKQIENIGQEFAQREASINHAYDLEMQRISELSEATDDQVKRLREAANETRRREIAELRKDRRDKEDKLRLEQIENMRNIINNSLGVAQQIASILGIGSHTFAFTLLNALQQGVSLATSIAQLIASINAASRTGGFLSGIVSLLSFLPGGAILGGATAALGGGGGFAAGGLIPGTAPPTGDNILAWVRSGEYVIKDSIVSKFGVGFFNAINSGRLPAYARGGLVPRVNINNSPNVNVGNAAKPDKSTKITNVNIGTKTVAKVVEKGNREKKFMEDYFGT